MPLEFKVAVGWLEKLAKRYVNLRDDRGAELDEIANELLTIPEALAPVFVEPEIQPYNPADDVDEEEFRQPVYQFLERFIGKNMEKSDGRKQLFILADAGMGKTSVLAMFKLGHINAFWPKGYDCVAIKLGPDTLAKIRKIQSRRRTVLLLDALDEDKAAYGRVKERIVELLKETQNFFRVIITCRTQFFPKSDDPAFGRQDRVRLDGFTCPVKYLCLFSDAQVRRYLERRFPSSFLQRVFRRENKTITYAEELVNRMNDLKSRPMLLAYIDDLIGERGLGDNPFLMYQTLVDKWLARESRKHNNPDEGKKHDRESMLLACLYLARELMREGSREVSKARLSELIMDYPELEHLEAIDVGGRSLLNRNSDGDYRFAHQSIQEYLVVLSLSKGHPWDFANATEMIVSFMRHADLENADLSGANLSGANLHGTRLKGARLVGAEMLETNLNGADLAGACLKDALLTSANLNEANLTGADLRGAGLKHASLYRAVLHNVDLGSADLMQCRMTKVNLRGASLVLTNLRGANLTEADLGNANLRDAMLNPATLMDPKPKLIWALVNRKVRQKKIAGHNLSEADLRSVDLSFCDLTGCDLTDSNLSEAVLIGANLSGANLSRTNLSGADLRTANLTGILFWDNAVITAETDLTGASNPPLGFVNYLKKQRR